MIVCPDPQDLNADIQHNHYYNPTVKEITHPTGIYQVHEFCWYHILQVYHSGLREFISDNIQLLVQVVLLCSTPLQTCMYIKHISVHNRSNTG